MNNLFCVIVAIALLPLTNLQSQEMDKRGPAGFHIGVVQPILAANNGEVQYINQSSFYAIGFPIGVTFYTPGSVLFDMELVPFVKPYTNAEQPYDVHLLFHPGILFPLKGGFTFGLRLAFETGQGQFGFTPLINKSFSISPGKSFFVELVAPGRFGPQKNSGYTQIAGLHIGLGF